MLSQGWLEHLGPFNPLRGTHEFTGKGRVMRQKFVFLTNKRFRQREPELAVMYAGNEQCLCVFRYLIPCSHLSRKQRCSLQQRDCYSSSAASFLLLMPSWCPGNLNHTNTLLHSEHIHWPKGAGQYDQHAVHVHNTHE